MIVNYHNYKSNEDINIDDITLYDEWKNKSKVKLRFVLRIKIYDESKIRIQGHLNYKGLKSMKMEFGSNCSLNFFHLNWNLAGWFLLFLIKAIILTI